MKARSRSAHAPRTRRGAAPFVGAVVASLVVAMLAGCAAESAPSSTAHVAPLPSDPRVLAAEIDARLEALRKQSEPASDDVIGSLERTLREQREKRARAVVAAGTTAVIPAGAAPAQPVSAAPLATPAPVAVAAASAPVKQTKASRAAAAKAAAASAAAARSAAANAKFDGVAAGPTSTATPMPIPMPPTTMTTTTAATVVGPDRTPMSRSAESRLPVSELYERARALELQLQTVQAIALYRECSQRGHAPSSQRLMELYADGAPGVARDYRVAVFFKERAVQQGVSFDPTWRR